MLSKWSGGTRAIWNYKEPRKEPFNPSILDGALCEAQEEPVAEASRVEGHNAQAGWHLQLTGFQRWAHGLLSDDCQGSQVGF